MPLLFFNRVLPDSKIEQLLQLVWGSYDEEPDQSILVHESMDGRIDIWQEWYSNWSIPIATLNFPLLPFQNIPKFTEMTAWMDIVAGNGIVQQISGIFLYIVMIIIIMSL